MMMMMMKLAQNTEDIFYRHSIGTSQADVITSDVTLLVRILLFRHVMGGTGIAFIFEVIR